MFFSYNNKASPVDSIWDNAAKYYTSLKDKDLHAIANQQVLHIPDQIITTQEHNLLKESNLKGLALEHEFNPKLRPK
ncbi:MAG: hypothetical protein JSS07_05240 [Proteobacteria bacterium]|nr:hypothetical protein [Pseudomonadota bacterium]